MLICVKQLRPQTIIKHTNVMLLINYRLQHKPANWPKNLDSYLSLSIINGFRILHQITSKRITLLSMCTFRNAFLLILLNVLMNIHPIHTLLWWHSILVQKLINQMLFMSDKPSHSSD